MRNSGFALLYHALTGNKRWRPLWRKAQPKKHYEVLIIGGGGHGLATAYYLAKNHGIKNIAVVEKSYLGAGNVGRNTTIIRSNYMLPGNNRFYEHSMKLWEGLSRELNYNVMFSQRGVLNLAHSDAQMDMFARRGNSMRLQGIDALLLSRDEVKEYAPMCDFRPQARFPIYGGLLQKRGGTARHDAIAWGYARAADRLGVDIIERCEALDFIEEQGVISGVKTSLGEIRADKVALCLAGSTSLLTSKLSINLPIESHCLQAFVTEGLKPCFDHVVTFGVGHFYMSQSDKGGLVFGGDLDQYNSYAQRGQLNMVEHVLQAGISMAPMLSRVRLLRSWGGIMDMSMDGSPIICCGPAPGLYLNTGWCYGGFKATPASGWVFAHTIANDAPHELNSSYSLDRFATGHLLDEEGTGSSPWLH